MSRKMILGFAAAAVLLVAAPAEAACNKYEKLLEKCERKAQRWTENCEDNCSAKATKCRWKNRHRPNAKERCDDRESECKSRCEKKGEKRCARAKKALERCERKGNTAVGRLGKVKFERIKVRGSCTADQIKSTLLRRMAVFLPCYEKQLKASPKLEGYLELQFTIGMYGRVMGPAKAIKVSPALKNSPVVSCTSSRFQSVRFPRPKAGVCIPQFGLTYKPR